MKTSLRLGHWRISIVQSLIPTFQPAHACTNAVSEVHLWQCVRKFKNNGFKLSMEISQVPNNCTGCFRAGQTAAPATGANTTTFTGSPECSSCCIPQQSQPWVSELGSFHSSKMGVTQMPQVLPLSVHKLVLVLILVLCSAALVPEMDRRRTRSAHLKILGKENIGILRYKTFLLFLSHFSISIHLHWIHRIASLSQYLLLSQLFKNKQKQTKNLKQNQKNNPTLNLPLISEQWKMTA